MTAIIETHDLHLGYGANRVIQGVSIAVQPGAITTFLGRNGAGKSTLLQGIAGVLKPLQGGICFLGASTAAWDNRERIRRGLIYAAQGRECFVDLSVRENMDAAMLALRVERRLREARREELLALFPSLRPVLKEPAHRLSGGLQQMLVLAMAFAQKPKCLLLDEPSLGLSAAVLDELEGLLRRFVDGGGAILLAEQKPNMVFRVGDYAYFLENGRVALEGHPRELRENPEFVGRYLGLAHVWGK